MFGPETWTEGFPPWEWLPKVREVTAANGQQFPVAKKPREKVKIREEPNSPLRQLEELSRRAAAEMSPGLMFPDSDMSPALRRLFEDPTVDRLDDLAMGHVAGQKQGGKRLPFCLRLFRQADAHS